MLRVMYAPGASHEQRAQADHWLQDFQASTEAWAFAHQCLTNRAHASPEALFFAALTLHSKIQQDFDELPVPQLMPLRAGLMQHVAAFTAGPRNVLNRVCLALAAFAVQTAPSWGPQRPQQSQHPGGDCGGVVPVLLESFGAQQATWPSLLELLTVLLEEATSRRLRCVTANPQGVTVP